MFFVGVLTFTLALQYNSFSQTMLKQFSHGKEITLMSSGVNVIVFTLVVFGILKLIWSYDSKIASHGL